MSDNCLVPLDHPMNNERQAEGHDENDDLHHIKNVNPQQVANGPQAQVLGELCHDDQHAHDEPSTSVPNSLPSRRENTVMKQP